VKVCVCSQTHLLLGGSVIATHSRVPDKERDACAWCSCCSPDSPSGPCCDSSLQVTPPSALTASTEQQVVAPICLPPIHKDLPLDCRLVAACRWQNPVAPRSLCALLPSWASGGCPSGPSRCSHNKCQKSTSQACTSCMGPHNALVPPPDWPACTAASVAVARLASCLPGSRRPCALPLLPNRLAATLQCLSLPPHLVAMGKLIAAQNAGAQDAAPGAQLLPLARRRKHTGVFVNPNYRTCLPCAQVG